MVVAGLQACPPYRMAIGETSIPALLRVACNGSRGIANPAAPRRRINARAGQACVLHRQQVVAGGYAGAAHVHDICDGVMSPINARNSSRNCSAGLNRPSASRFSWKRSIQRARHMSGDRIDRLDFAAITRARTRVEQKYILLHLLQFIGVDDLLRVEFAP